MCVGEVEAGVSQVCAGSGAGGCRGGVCVFLVRVLFLGGES